MLSTAAFDRRLAAISRIKRDGMKRQALLKLNRCLLPHLSAWQEKFYGQVVRMWEGIDDQAKADT